MPWDEGTSVAVFLLPATVTQRERCALVGGLYASREENVICQLHICRPFVSSLVAEGCAAATREAAQVLLPVQSARLLCDHPLKRRAHAHCASCWLNLFATFTWLPLRPGSRLRHRIALQGML